MRSPHTARSLSLSLSLSPSFSIQLLCTNYYKQQRDYIIIIRNKKKERRKRENKTTYKRQLDAWSLKLLIETQSAYFVS